MYLGLKYKTPNFFHISFFNVSFNLLNIKNTIGMSGIIIVLGVIFLIAVFLIQIFNRFVKNRNTVKDGWSNIDVALKRRYDLIPNLVETVKGYAAHEKTTLENVIKARNAAMAVPSNDINAQIKAENQLQQTLRSIFALSEAYPDLKANTNFLDLQQKLNEIEENLERSRRYYNGTVRENNTYGESFPGVLFAGMFKYQHFDYFETDEASRENVKINFN